MQWEEERSMRRSSRPTYATLVIATMIAAGCTSGGAPASPSAAATPAPATASPAPSAAGPIVLEDAGVDVELPTGTYTSRVFTPHVTLELGAPWLRKDEIDPSRIKLSH